MADAERLICASRELVDSGRGVRFEVEYFGEPAPAFAIRYRGHAHGYLNRCAHVAMELDWQEGVFFDSAGRDLVCGTHGAVYEAATGRCIEGPCIRSRLVKLKIEERDGMVYFQGFEEE
jgi:nitrite reductase/ring-hydroxylating ferredoxin subunit